MKKIEVYITDLEVDNPLKIKIMERKTEELVEDGYLTPSPTILNLYYYDFYNYNPNKDYVVIVYDEVLEDTISVFSIDSEKEFNGFYA